MSKNLSLSHFHKYFSRLLITTKFCKVTWGVLEAPEPSVHRYAGQNYGRQKSPIKTMIMGTLRIGIGIQSIKVLRFLKFDKNGIH